MSFRNCSGRRGQLSPVDAEREWFARVLWKAFPEATSADEVAALAAEVLSRDGRPVTARAVTNWLRCENTPHFRYVLPLLAMAGSEALFAFFDPEVRR
jgi:hypothetical protein